MDDKWRSVHSHRLLVIVRELLALTSGKHANGARSAVDVYGSFDGRDATGQENNYSRLNELFPISLCSSMT